MASETQEQRAQRESSLTKLVRVRPERRHLNGRWWCVVAWVPGHKQALRGWGKTLTEAEDEVSVLVDDALGRWQWVFEREVKP